MFGLFPIESTLVGKDVQKRPATYLNVGASQPFYFQNTLFVDRAFSG